MPQLFRNNAFSNLGASLTNVATTLTVTTGHGDRFPVVTAPDFFLLTLQDASNNIEIVKVTARTAGSDSMTIVRAQEGTTARAWNLGDVVELRLTASALNPLSLMEGASTAATVRAAIDAAASSHTHTASQISDSTAVGRAVLTAADEAAARAAINAAASSHTHQASQISDSTAVGRAVLTAADEAAARAAINAAATGPATSSGLTQSSGKILGRTSAGSGAIEEISAGTGLTLASGVLNASIASTAEAQAGTDDTKLMTPVKTWDAIRSAGIFSGPVGLVQVATGGGAGLYQRVDGNFNPMTVGQSAFHMHPTYRGIVEQIIDGQWMVRIPKFYFKAGTVPSGTYTGKAYWMISDQPVSGFAVHPAFIGAGGAELDQIWVGKYQAGFDGSSKAISVPGVAPMVSMDFPTARARAYARNTGGVTGFRLLSYYDLAAIQLLASIEMGGLDMQSLIGQGRVNTTSAANVDASDVAQATWRGIVGLWGNVWQMVDGLKRNGGNWWRWQYNVPGNTTTSDFATGYINTGQAALTSVGYPVTFDTTLLAAGVIAPATVDGTASNGSTGDYFWSNTTTSDQVAYHGGSWSVGADAGLFCLNVTSAPSNALSYLGARLAKV